MNTNVKVINATYTSRGFSESYLHINPHGGLLMVVSEKFSVGTRLEVQIRLEDLRAVMISPGEVVWTRFESGARGWDIIVQFLSEMRSANPGDLFLDQPPVEGSKKNMRSTIAPREVGRPTTSPEPSGGWSPVMEGALVAGKYLCEIRLGKGGTASVFKARHVQIDKIVSIKFLHNVLSPDVFPKERFLKEARMASSLNHDSIINIYDFGIDETYGHYIIMEYVEGPSLADEMEIHEVFKLRYFYDIMSQLCDALAYAHERGVIHCDLKPENIMLTKIAGSERRRRVKILDFGISRRLQEEIEETGSVRGTPEYMAPEQLRGEPVDARTDVYALGIIMYEMLTGDIPFITDDLDILIQMQLTAKPQTLSRCRPDLDHDQRLDEIVLKALEKDKAHRQQSVTALLFELNTFMDMIGFRTRRHQKE